MKSTKVFLFTIGTWFAVCGSALGQTSGPACEKMAEQSSSGQNFSLGGNSLTFKDARRGKLTVKASIVQGAGEFMSNLWGSESGPAKTFFGRFHIEFNGEDVYVPYSAYADLGNPIHVSVHIRPGNRFTILIFGGGDAANAWFVCMDVFRNKIVKRVLLSQLEWREETNYRQ